MQRPHTPFSSYPPPRAAWRQAQTRPVGRPQTARQPRCQRRVARPSGADTVCTERREKPRATPFRVLLPRPPGGGLGAGGQGGARRKPVVARKRTDTRDRLAQCSKAIRAPGPPRGSLGPTTCSAPTRHFLRTPAKGSVETRSNLPCGAAANNPPATPSAPRRPPIGHRYSVHGKPRKSANHAIPRPTPLAPWRGPRGLGVRGCRFPSVWENQDSPRDASQPNKTLRRRLQRTRLVQLRVRRRATAGWKRVCGHSLHGRNRLLARLSRRRP